MDTRMSTETVNLATLMRIMLMATPMAMHTDIRMEEFHVMGMGMGISGRSLEDMTNEEGE